MIESLCKSIVFRLFMNIPLHLSSISILIYDPYISTSIIEIIWLNNFPDFFGFLLYDFELSILLNHTEHPQRYNVVMYYSFYNSKSFKPNG